MCYIAKYPLRVAVVVLESTPRSVNTRKQTQAQFSQFNIPFIYAFSFRVPFKVFLSLTQNKMIEGRIKEPYTVESTLDNHPARPSGNRAVCGVAILYECAKINPYSTIATTTAAVAAFLSTEPPFTSQSIQRVKKDDDIKEGLTPKFSFGILSFLLCRKISVS